MKFGKITKPTKLVIKKIVRIRCGEYRCKQSGSD